jgi:ParB family transcriptional regulator, chromosome partitioning protein
MVKKRGLGKSLDALLVGTLTATREMDEPHSHTEEKFCQLPITVLQRGKYQPRRGMDTEALEELASSIRAQGIIQPVVVRHLPGGRYEIIAGERRWRAAQLAGLTEIPAIVRTIPDDAAIAIALIENIQREGLNPIEEAFALQRLMDEFSMTHQQVADAVGKARATVTNLLRLLTLTEEVRSLLEKGKLEMAHARALLTLSPELQIKAAATIIARGASVRETEEMVRRMQLPVDLGGVASKMVDPEIKRIQQDLTHKLHLKVAIQSNSKGKGKLVIQYNNHNELDKLLEFFQ